MPRWTTRRRLLHQRPHDALNQTPATASAPGRTRSYLPGAADRSAESSRSEHTPTFFPAPSDFRAWLEEHHATADHLWVGYYEKATNKLSVTWEDTVDEALCYGKMTNTMHPMRLESVNSLCYLRPWLRTDVPSLVHHANDVDVWRNLTHAFPHPYTEADAIAWVEMAAEPGRSVHLAIELDGKAIGGLGAIAGEGIACATAQFGYWLGQEHWGKGLATAAAGALLNHLEEHKLFARVEASVFAWNPASMRVLEKLGFVREGVLRRSVTKDGQLIDSVMYAYVIAI